MSTPILGYIPINNNNSCINNNILLLNDTIYTCVSVLIYLCGYRDLVNSQSHKCISFIFLLIWLKIFFLPNAVKLILIKSMFCLFQVSVMWICHSSSSSIHSHTQHVSLFYISSKKKIIFMFIFLSHQFYIYVKSWQEIQLFTNFEYK